MNTLFKMTFLISQKNQLNKITFEMAAQPGNSSFKKHQLRWQADKTRRNQLNSLSKKDKIIGEPQQSSRNVRILQANDQSPANNLMTSHSCNHIANRLRF